MTVKPAAQIERRRAALRTLLAVLTTSLFTPEEIEAVVDYARLACRQRFLSAAGWAST